MENQESIINKPILPDEIEWKVQSYTKDKSKTIIVPYVTARCVMERFDAEFGVMGWQTTFREVESGFICHLSVFTNDTWISKEDGANRTKIEPIKGGISDSLKRAAHQFGLGRCLYSYPRIMIKGEHKFISEGIMKLLNEIVVQINAGNFNKKVVVLSEDDKNKTETDPQPETDQEPDKPWLNKWRDKDKTLIFDSYKKLISQAKDKGMGVDELRDHYKISKDMVTELETDLKA